MKPATAPWWGEQALGERAALWRRAVRRTAKLFPSPVAGCDISVGRGVALPGRTARTAAKG